MICPTCNTESHHIRITSRGTTCHNCGGFSETSGKSVDSVQTRNSFRVREQQQHYEGDMLPPYRYNHETRRAEPNPEFIKLHPNQVGSHFTPDQLRAANMPKLARKIEKTGTPAADKGVKFKGNTKQGIKKAIRATGR